MTTTTTNRMNILLQKAEARINAKIPQSLYDAVEEKCLKLKVSKSLYLKMALSEKLERDLNQ